MSDYKISTKFIACGGGESITLILNKLSKICSFKNKKIAYLIIAIENDHIFLKEVYNRFNHLKNIFGSLGAKNVYLVERKNISDLCNAQIIILSGGDTSFLINALKNQNFIEKINNCDFKPEAIIGISAGAIVLFEEGIGVKDDKEYLFKGLGLIRGMVVVHSNEKLKKKYPHAIHLKDYELYGDKN